MILPQVAVFLASDDLRWMTSEQLLASGGIRKRVNPKTRKQDPSLTGAESIVFLLKKKLPEYRHRLTKFCVCKIILKCEMTINTNKNNCL